MGAPPSDERPGPASPSSFSSPLRSCTCIPENSDRVFLSTEGSYCEKMTGGCPA